MFFGRCVFIPSSSLILRSLWIAGLASALLPLSAQAQVSDALQLKERRQTLVEPETSQPAKPFHGVRYKANSVGTGKAHGQNVPAQCTSPKASYFGGPVISNVQPIVVFWNSDVNAALTAPTTGIAQFLGDLSNSSFMSVLTQYSTYGTNLETAGTNQWIGNGSASVPSYTITPSKCAAGSTNCTVTDADIQTELQAQISSNVLPAQTYDSNGNSNTLYMTYFPPGVHVNASSIGAGDSCVEFCAYHNTGGSISAPLTYGVLMDEFTSACATGCGDDATPMENQTNASSHEFAEAITDTEIGLDSSSDYAYPGAWGDNDNNCGEVADICDANAPGDAITVSGRNWIVQELWSNEDNQCESSGTVNLPFAFTGSSTAATGTPVNFTITAQNPTGGANTGYRGTVHFTSSDSSALLPADYTYISTDAGVKTLSATFESASTQTITATDTANSKLTAKTSFTVSETQVAVPNVVGDPLATAETDITTAGLTVGNVTYEFCGTVPAGDVISESPKAGKQVDTGSSVNLVVSSGPTMYTLTVDKSPSNGGTVSPSGGSYSPNKVVTLTATPAAGFVFAGWSGPVSSTTSNPTKITMKGSETVTAKFASSLTVSPTSIDFGTVYLGTVTPRTVTVTNNGSSTVSITNPLVFIVPVGDSKEFLAENLCSKPLAPHKSCTIRISYIAGPFYHQQSAWLNVSDNTAASPKTVSLTGLTIDPAATLSPTSLSFGSLKTHVTSAAKTVTLTNSGATALSVQSITIGGSTPSDFKQANNCPSSLSAGAHCIISVTFNAVSKGAKSAKIELKDNAQNSPQSVPLSGTGD